MCGVVISGLANFFQDWILVKKSSSIGPEKPEKTIISAFKSYLVHFGSFKRIFCILCKHCRENSKSLRRMSGYIVAQSASLYALLFVIINIYSVYSIYFSVGHFNFIQGYILYK